MTRKKITYLLIINCLCNFVFGQSTYSTTFDYSQIQVEEVDFVGSDQIKIHRDFIPHAEFGNPEWKKGRDEQYPVGYPAGKKASVSAIFSICNTIPNGKVLYAKGVAPNSITFEVKPITVQNGKATYPITEANKAFLAGMVDYFPNFNIAWSISLDKINWVAVGQSKNPLYVPLSNLSVCGPDHDDNNIYYSTIHYACEPAKGNSAADVILQKIWNRFATLQVPRIDKPKSVAMKYWGADNSLGYGCRGVKGLLNYEDANCGEWSLFFRNCVGMHGILSNIQGCQGVVLAIEPAVLQKNAFEIEYFNHFQKNYPANQTRATFLVKNWDIPNLNKFYYIGKKHIAFNPVVPFPGSSAYTPDYGSFTAANGFLIQRGDKINDKAQGMIDPEPLFADHVVVCMPDGKIYDPSYGGTPYNDIKNWEYNSITGYALQTVLYVENGEQRYLIWPYSLENINLQQTQYECKK